MKKISVKNCSVCDFNVLFFAVSVFFCLPYFGYHLVLNCHKMATAPVSRKRNAYSILERLQIVERIHKGEKQAKVIKLGSQVHSARDSSWMAKR